MAFFNFNKKKSEGISHAWFLFLFAFFASSVLFVGGQMLTFEFSESLTADVSGMKVSEVTEAFGCENQVEAVKRTYAPKFGTGFESELYWAFDKAFPKTVVEIGGWVDSSKPYAIDVFVKKPSPGTGVCEVSFVQSWAVSSFRFPEEVKSLTFGRPLAYEAFPIFSVASVLKKRAEDSSRADTLTRELGTRVGSGNEGKQ